MTKHWFPDSKYCGLDIERYNNSPDDLAAIDDFYKLDLQRDSLSVIPSGYFDLVLLVHVVEHLSNGEHVVKELAKKLKPGGSLYIETPSERSLKLPSGVDCLNFYDDPTHVRLYRLNELINACREAGLQIKASGLRRDIAWMLVGLAMFPKQILSLVKHRKPFGPGLWDLVGFAHFVEAARPQTE
jgi:SAM-dependent methyltransferase